MQMYPLAIASAEIRHRRYLPKAHAFETQLTYLWFAYPVLGLAAGCYELWIYPLLMWLFLYYITGIPFSEQQALTHRGDNYKDYQRRTSMFIPWPPKQ